MFDVTQAAISRINVHRREILQNKEVSEKENMSLKRKRFSNIITSDRERKLVEWCNENQAAGIPISGKSVQEAAMVLNEMCNGPNNFKAGSGFLDKFQRRHNMRSIKLQGERLSADSAAATEFCATFIKFVNDFNFDRDQIYNADESGLLWKCLPGRTLLNKETKNASGWKLHKDRVTIMFCANASGTHKIPLFLIGKYRNPHCFRGINKDALPLMYTNQKSAWMDKMCFIKWYTELFLPEVTARFAGTGKKCILVLDNAPTHPDASTLNALNDICTIIYLPPNVTSLIQPMDQGVIEKFKRLYRQNLLRSLLLSAKQVPEFSKSMDIYKCVKFSCQAWDDIIASNAVNAWRKIFGNDEDDNAMFMDEGNTEHLVENLHRMPEFANVSTDDISEWYSSDKMCPGWEVRTVEQVIAGTSEESSNIDEETKAEIGLEYEETPSSSEAAEAAEKFQRWCLTRWDFSTEQYSELESMLRLAKGVAFNDRFPFGKK